MEEVAESGLEKMLRIMRAVEKKYNEEEIIDAIEQISLANILNEKLTQTLTRHLLEKLVYRPTLPNLLQILELTIYESLLASKIYRIIPNDDSDNKYVIVMTTNKHEHRIILTFKEEFHRLDDDDVKVFDVDVRWIVDDNREMKVNTVMKLIIFNKLLDELKRYVRYLLRKQI